MECPKCNGKGGDNEVVNTCSKAIGDCCGGCTEWIDCELCNGGGYFGGDLFEMYDEHREYFDEEVLTILDNLDFKFAKEGLTYNDCQDCNLMLKKHGYSFDFDLSATPYNLHKI